METTKNHQEAQKLQKKTKKMNLKKVISQGKKRQENEILFSLFEIVYLFIIINF